MAMNIIIRQEQSSDYQETENVNREAFWNVYCPQCSEHYLVHIMRNSDAFIKELDLVAVDGDKIVGNVMYLKSIIIGDDGKNHEVLSLGPISVLPEYQRKGIAKKLIETSKKIARELGYKAILLCGDPMFYTKMGFVEAETYCIRNADNMYLKALHVCELYEDALKEISGRYVENVIYDVDERKVELFDQQFPKKEAVRNNASQKRFKEVCAMVKPYN